MQKIVRADGPVSEALEEEYLRDSIHSSRLLEALRRQLSGFDAVVVGPYLHSLTYDVARAFPGKTLLLPCFHDEPFLHLRAWFLDPATRMTPSILYAQTILPAKTGRPEGLVEAVHLAEVIQSLLFLTNSEALTETDFTGLKKWFAEYFDWLNTSRLAGLARDNKNHHGTSWLLQAAAIPLRSPVQSKRHT